jgi:hypothetical protein
MNKIPFGTCDAILYVNMFHYFKTPYIICMVFFSKIIYNIYIYILDPIFLSHVVSTIFASDLPVVEFDDYKFKYWFELENKEKPNVCHRLRVRYVAL